MITKKDYLLTILLCTFFIGNIFGQESEERNWSIEFGVVKSYMNSTLDFENTETNYKARLNYSWLLPTLRLSRHINFKNNAISLKPFIGFSILGVNKGSFNKGSFHIDSTTYFLSTMGTEFQLYYGEFGSFISYSVGQFDFQFGLKGQYLLGTNTLITSDYIPGRVRLTPTPLPDNQELNYSGKKLTDFSANLGLKIQYNWNRFTFATEYWQGITNLSSAEGDWFSNKIYEYNFRLMLGYKF